MGDWVRVEHEAKGNITGYSDFNLDRINRVKVGRQDGKVTTVLVVPEGEPNSMEMLEGDAARVFAEAWELHLGASLKPLNKQATPGVIQIHGSGDIIQK